jgi:hypothetical protein
MFLNNSTVFCAQNQVFNPLENVQNHRSPLAFHRFWDGLAIAFSSFLHSDIAPLPNPAKHVFEQQYGVLRSKSSFQIFRFNTMFLKRALAIFPNLRRI